MGLSWNMRRGRRDRILLTVGICPHLKSRLIRQKLMSRKPLCELIEEALLAYLPADTNQPIRPGPRQPVDQQAINHGAIDYGAWTVY